MQVVEKADFACNIDGGRKTQLLTFPQHPQPPGGLHHLVLSRCRAKRQQAHRLGEELQVGPAATRLVKDDKRVLLGHRRGVAGQAAPPRLSHHPTALEDVVVAHALEACPVQSPNQVLGSFSLFGGEVCDESLNNSCQVTTGN